MKVNQTKFCKVFSKTILYGRKQSIWIIWLSKHYKIYWIYMIARNIQKQLYILFKLVGTYFLFKLQCVDKVVTIINCLSIT